MDWFSDPDERQSTQGIMIFHTGLSIKIGALLAYYSYQQMSDVYSFITTPGNLALPPTAYPAAQLMFASCIFRIVVVVGQLITWLKVSRTALEKSPWVYYAQGLADMAVVGSVIGATVMQLTYLPASVSACYPYSGYPAVEALFISAIDDHTDASGVCSNFQSIWILSITFSVGVFNMGLIRLFNPNKHVALFMAFPIWGPVALFYGFFVGIKHAFLRGVWPVIKFLPLMILFLSRRSDKWRDRNTEEKSPRIIEQGQMQPSETLIAPTKWLPSQHEVIVESSKVATLTSRFEEVFGDKKLLISLIRDCHLQDVIQLGSTSRYMRFLLLHLSPEEQPSETLDMAFFRGISCQQGTRSQCWGCGIQTCYGCGFWLTINVPLLTQSHLQYCEPRCSRCHLNNLVGRRKPSYSWCDHSSRSMAAGKHIICSGCADIGRQGIDGVRRRREAREVEELKHLAISSVRCGKCKQKLKMNTPRWWACCLCDEECDSVYHPSWRSPPR